MSRDPYHAARVRFKVARDRWQKNLLGPKRIWDWFSSDRYWHAQMFTPERFRFGDAHYIDELKVHGWAEMVEAACILHTMLTFKITDEQQALMLWKLSRD